MAANLNRQQLEWSTSYLKLLKPATKRFSLSRRFSIARYSNNAFKLKSFFVFRLAVIKRRLNAPKWAHYINTDFFISQNKNTLYVKQNNAVNFPTFIIKTQLFYYFMRIQCMSFCK